MIASSGYTGGAWDTDPSGATITGNTTYTYTFTAVPTYTVTYSIVNGTWADGTTADKTETVASGASPASIPTGMIASSGYTGGAWDTDPSGANITANTTYTYTFTAVPTYTVTFNANGHGTAPAVQTITIGGTATEPTAPTADGWTFGGWYQDATCSVAFDFATPITANTELYAKWTEVPATTYTVTFNANGHGTAPAAQTITSGGTATEPTAPTADGWTFGGWYQDATCSVAFDFATPITANTELYAKWTEVTSGTVNYTVVSGGNSTFTIGSASDLVITVKRSEADDTCFSHFTGVEIDGVSLVNGSDYTAVAGSTVITIKAATLNNLSEGGHTIRFIFDDGEIITSVTAKAATSTPTPTPTQSSAIPATGEEVGPALYVGFSCIAVAVMLFAVVLVWRKKLNAQR